MAEYEVETVEFRFAIIIVINGDFVENLSGFSHCIAFIRIIYVPLPLLKPFTVTRQAIHTYTHRI